MTPERWRQVKELFEAALERAPDKRPAYLDQACDGDEPLRREVQSLLVSYEEGESFMERPAVALAAETLAGPQAESLVGQTIRHYQVTREIGSGGMGEVYLAQDAKLGRPVALKLVPALFTRDEDRLRRFEREARTASALNHPNVCVIHEVGETEDHRHYIAMEYIDGVTLRQHMMSAPMGLSEVLDVAVQIASGLAAAHEVGIVHRDIKPENIMLRRDGYVKVLDFGLAKLTEQPTTDVPIPAGPRAKTDTGVVMGTSRYMSPEQARGLAVDARTDIWSLGVVIYEMVTGGPPFEGATTSDVIVSILEREPPPLAQLSPEAPAELQRITSKTLHKDREGRYQTAKDLLIDLKNLKQDLELEAKLEHSQQPGSSGSGQLKTSATVPVARPQPRWWANRLIWLSAALILVVGVAVTFYLSRLPSESSIRSTPESTLPPIKVVPLTSLPGTKMTPAFSSDGNQVAFAWNRTEPPGVEIFVKLVSEGEPRQLTHSGKINFSPVWSPNGQRIAFVRIISEGETAIFTISAYGEGERKLVSFDQGGERRISWSPDGKFLAFADSDKNQPSRGYATFLLSLDTLEKRALTSPPADHYDEGPAFSPDGHALAFVRGSNSASGLDLYVVPVSGGEPRRLTFGDDLFWTGPTWTEDGREIVFSSKRTGVSALWRIPVSGGNPQRLEVGGDDSVQPSISRQGHRLAYMRFPLDVNIYRIVLPDAKNPGNSPAPFLASTRRDTEAQLSPDGKRIAFQSNRSGSSDEIWVCAIDGSNCTQVTSLGTPTGTSTGHPRWSPDGKRIVCDSVRDGKTSIYTIDLESREVRGLVADSSEERVPSWSRDGQWVYFASKRSGSWQIWKVLAEGGAPVQITKQGGFLPFESSDARFVYYDKGGDVAGVWRVPIDGGEEILILDQLKPEVGPNWAVVDDGIYFIRFDVNTKEKGAILFFDFATGRVKEIVKLGRDHIIQGGLAVSSDRRSFFYTVWEHPGGDIMLVENFR